MCGPAIFRDNLDGLHEKRGLPWARYRLGVVSAAVGDSRIVNALMDAGVFAYDPSTESESPNAC